MRVTPVLGAEPGMGESWSVHLRPLRVVAGAGALAQLPELVQGYGSRRVLVVTDRGIRRAGHVDRALEVLHRDLEGTATEVFDGVLENPTESNVADGAEHARAFAPDLIVGLGGGSAMDCAKGVNFVHTNGGRMRDFAGFGKAHHPMLPSIGVPCSTGTGSEAQSFALISRDDDHLKMACGDEKARFKAVILDSELAATQPADVFALTVLDAVSHAVEAFVTRTRNPISTQFAKGAWGLLSARIPEWLEGRNRDSSALWLDLLTGAHLAGAAIEMSMLGAAHALANPLSAAFDVEHGAAVGIMLPTVVRWNAETGAADYRGLADGAGSVSGAAEHLASTIEAWRAGLGVPSHLSEVGVTEDRIEDLSVMAAEQWTGRHNPRPMSAADARTLYRSALGSAAVPKGTGIAESASEVEEGSGSPISRETSRVG